MRHPGKIEYYENVDGVENKVNEEKIENVPETMRFAPSDKEMVPVVKVIMYKKGNFREIVEFGPKGQFLRSTIGSSR